jgi:hypothetical protein
MTPQIAHSILAKASAKALLNEADRMQVFEANQVLQEHLKAGHGFTGNAAHRIKQKEDQLSETRLAEHMREQTG